MARTKKTTISNKSFQVYKSQARNDKGTKGRKARQRLYEMGLVVLPAGSKLKGERKGVVKVSTLEEISAKYDKMHNVGHAKTNRNLGAKKLDYTKMPDTIKDLGRVEMFEHGLDVNEKITKADIVKIQSYQDIELGGIEMINYAMNYLWGAYEVHMIKQEEINIIDQSLHNAYLDGEQDSIYEYLTNDKYRLTRTVSTTHDYSQDYENGTSAVEDMDESPIFLGFKKWCEDYGITMIG